MLGLGSSAVALPIKQWEPTDHPNLELWMQAHTDFVVYTSEPTLSRWSSRYPEGSSQFVFAQATAENQPTLNQNATEYAITFVTDDSGSDDDVLLEADDSVTLDTSAGGWTMAFVATCTENPTNSVTDDPNRPC